MIKRMSGAVRGFKKSAILAPFFMIMEVLAEAAIPFLMSLLIDNGIEKGDMSAVVFYGVILLCLSLFTLTTGALSGAYAAKAATGFSMNLRNDMFAGVQRFSFSNIDKFSSSSLITRLTTDVINVQNAFQSAIRHGVRCVALIAAALVMVFRISAQLAIIYVFIMPVLAFVLFFIIYKVHPVFLSVIKSYDTLNDTVQENLHAVRVVKSYVSQRAEEEKFGTVSKIIYKSFVKAQKKVALNPTAIQFCVYLSMILISWLGAKLVVQKTMSTGELMSFFTYTMQLLMSLMLMSNVLVLIVIAWPSAHRVTEVLAEEPDLENPADPVFELKDGSVCFKDVGFSYVGDSEKLCLSEVNLKVNSGETVGVIGGTGSSKTTLVQLIPRLYDATVGEVLVGGLDVKKYDLQSLRNAVAVVLQKNTLFSGTVRENLLWGNENADDEEIWQACRLAQAAEFVEAFPNGLDTVIERDGTNVSGGQRQRLCIARALLKKPKILILDDSTSAVDTKTDALLRKAFKEQLPETTKFIIAQRVASVMEADKIIVMEGGMINASGTHEQLMKSSQIYREVYNTQKHGGGDFDETAEQ